ncbi:MAG TPA: peptidase [Thermoanaerobaculia bacterium]|nr:peptidase [Thermoanaerobaculia bacterium]
MKQTARSVLLLIVIASLSGCVRTAPMSTPSVAVHPPVAAGIGQRLAQLPKTPIDYDRSLLDENEQRVVARLVEASRFIDQIFWLQVSENNPRWRTELEAAARSSEAHRDALAWLINMKGPWDRLKDDEPFVLSAGPKPEGAGFYPADMTKEELERWLEAHPEDKESFQSLFTVIRREGGRLVAIPYSSHYRDLLGQAAARMREAAAMTNNASLRNYLTTRADAFFTDDYFASDIAWMDLDSDIEVVIGPYEVYEDRLFNYKASFESFVTAVDKEETKRLDVYTSHLPSMERNLPIGDEHKNPNRGTDSPLRVVQEIYTAGDARRGVQTAAFNLPNDERVREAKGSKQVLLRNVMEAKYRTTGHPIALRVLDPSQTHLVSFDAFFNNVLFHELAHGIGPGIIDGPAGERVEARILLKNLYSTIEEAKADVAGTWSLLWAMDQRLVTDFDRETLFATEVGLMFRSMRFGLTAAHGRGNAIQWNWYREKGAIVAAAGGRFRVDMAVMPESVRSLAHELLMIEATGDFERAQRLVDRYGQSTAEIESVIARLSDLPVDIDPIFVGAGER